MTGIIDKVIFDFKLMISLIRLYDSSSQTWSEMDESDKAIYNNEEEFIEVQLRASIQAYFVNEHIKKEFIK